MLNPSFMLFDSFLEILSHRVKKILLIEELMHKIDTLILKFRKGIKLVSICKIDFIFVVSNYRINDK